MGYPTSTYKPLTPTWDNGVLTNALSPTAGETNLGSILDSTATIGATAPTNLTVQDFKNLTSNQLEILGTMDFSDYSPGSLGSDPSIWEKMGNLDWGMNGMGGVALGGGQLALGLASYLDQSKTAKKQRKLIDQQIANNEFVLDKRKQNSESLAKAFGTWTGGSNGTAA